MGETFLFLNIFNSIGTAQLDAVFAAIQLNLNDQTILCPIR